MDLTEASQIEILSEKIQEILRDFSISVYSLCFAHYLIFEEKFSLEKCFELIKKKKFPEHFYQLLDSKSEMFGFIPRSVGITNVELSLRESLQSSLNVKQMKFLSNNSQVSSKIITPEISEDMLYSHKEYIWIRFYDENVLNFNEFEDVDVYKIGKNLYELYFLKTNGKISRIICNDNCKETISNSRNSFLITCLIDFIDKNGGKVEFCSELNNFFYNKLLFISNFLKFMFDYKTNSTLFDIKNYKHSQLTNSLIFNALSFFENQNCSITSDETHGPLIKYTGDNPINELKKCKLNHFYKNVGSRANISIDVPDNLGIHTSYIEMSGEYNIKNNNNCIDEII